MSAPRVSKVCSLLYELGRRAFFRLLPSMSFFDSTLRDWTRHAKRGRSGEHAGLLFVMHAAQETHLESQVGRHGERESVPVE